MQVVGVDFGTTNVRIATWDSSQPDLIPQPVLIGQEGASTMPAVVAFQRQPGGAVTTFVGEDADVLEKGPDTVVVDNIKRWALVGDAYVRKHLKAREVSCPDWWNPKTRRVEVWGQEFRAQEIIRQILAEAFRRADLTGEFEWRAGCPVQAGLEIPFRVGRGAVRVRWQERDFVDNRGTGPVPGFGSPS